MKTVFKVRVVTRDVFTDMFSRFRSIIGGRIKAYEKTIQQALEEAYEELLKDFPDVINVRFGTTEMINDGAEIIVYGEVTDERYLAYIQKKKKEFK
jgi:uncharacterized protein YbjQ (UPF0145 family)